MNNKIKELIKKYERIYNSSPWYGESITTILRNVNPQNVFNKASVRLHSIAELVAHMIGWMDIAFNQVQGNIKGRLTQKETFNWKRFDKNEKTAWKSLLKELDKNQKKITSLLKKKDDEFLNIKPPRKRQTTEFLIEGIIQHYIYHLGQIALLNKVFR